MPPDPLKKLEARIGHTFADQGLLAQALTHSSFAGALKSYERLEFLGDRVLGLLLAEYFYSRFLYDDEGALSIRLHAEARMSTLASVARGLNLASFVRAQSGFDVAVNDNVLADVMESLMAAIYLDGGLDAAQAFGAALAVKGVKTAERQKDAKSQLQEWCLQRGMSLPSYRQTNKSGPDHAPELTYEVSVSGYPREIATGSSRKSAEQAAAARLMARIAKESS